MKNCIDTHCRPAEVEDASAWCLHGTLFLVVRGKKPSPCDCIRVGKSPLRIWPPQFFVEWCPSTQICADVVTPYMAGDVFSLGQCPETITLVTSGGNRTVPVTKLDLHKPLTSFRMATAEDGEIEIPVEVLPCLDQAGDGNKGIGYSRDMSFDDAYQEALASLGPSDAMASRVRVTETGSQHGGFIGLDLLYVCVERENL